MDGFESPRTYITNAPQKISRHSRFPADWQIGEQYDSLPEDERYMGTKSVEELLEKKASGEPLDKQEEAYLKIFANLHDYERAAAHGRIQWDGSIHGMIFQ